MRAVVIAAVIAAGGGCASDRDRDGARPQGVHPSGIAEPGAVGFHGDVLRELDWDFALCQGCHGDDFGGGTSGQSCLDCHAEGPTACDTCHDESEDAHPTHLVTAGIACTECHVVPESWDAEGHILLASGARDDAPAEVVFGPLAARDVEPPRRTAAPAYDPATQTCSGVYCHGGILGDDAATASAPRWDQPGAAACGGCHGEPPADHAATAAGADGGCDACHRGAPHLDGTLDVGNVVAGGGIPVGLDGCIACHGDETSPAPPRSIFGETSPQTLAVGVHRAHLTSSQLRGPVPCATCHVVPTDVRSAGHIDTALPAEVVADIGWDRVTGTCAGYCHGDARPVWSHAGDGEASCGTCHGLPPTGGLHTPDMPISACTTCHPSVDAIGDIVFLTPETSEHLDGDVDLR